MYQIFFQSDYLCPIKDSYFLSWIWGRFPLLEDWSKMSEMNVNSLKEEGQSGFGKPQPHPSNEPHTSLSPDMAESYAYTQQFVYHILI